MKYVFQFGVVWDHLPQLLNGAWLTIRLSLGAFAVGFAIAILLAFLRTDYLPNQWSFSGLTTA